MGKAAIIRQQVAERAHSACEYCLSQEDYSPDTFSIEHILPRSRDGTSTLDNLAFSCQGCNNRKFTAVTAKDPISGVIVPLYNPRTDQWTTHFAWDETMTLMIGLTATGRATIERMQLNRYGVVNLRGLLIMIGKHPPY